MLALPLRLRDGSPDRVGRDAGLLLDQLPAVVNGLREGMQIHSLYREPVLLQALLGPNLSAVSPPRRRLAASIHGGQEAAAIGARFTRDGTMIPARTGGRILGRRPRGRLSAPGAQMGNAAG